jgi:hypothetical protein
MRQRVRGHGAEIHPIGLEAEAFLIAIDNLGDELSRLERLLAIQHFRT